MKHTGSKYKTNILHEPGPGIFNFYWSSSKIFPFIEKDLSYRVLLSEYTPGPGFLFLIVLTKGPVIYI